MYKREYVTPLMVLSFMVVAVTGTLMLLHVRSRPLGHLHEWMGLFFVIVGIIHVVLNWSVLKTYFKRTPMRISLAVVLLLSLVLLSGGAQDRHGLNSKSSHGVRAFGNR